MPSAILYLKLRPGSVSALTKRGPVANNEGPQLLNGSTSDSRLYNGSYLNETRHSRR
jgi:hypothetical protein